MFRFTISWRAIIAGVVTAFAVSVIMAVLGLALGFSVIHPMAENPFSGLGTAFGIWSVISVIVSLAAGGFMAGFVSTRRGGEHGFLTWATVLLFAGFLGGQAVGSAVDSIGDVLHDAGSTALDIGTDAGNGMVSLAGNVLNAVQEDLTDLSNDTVSMRGEVAQTLRASGVASLQPEFLRDQLRAARSDLRAAIHQVTLDSDNFDTALNGFISRQKDRVAAIGEGVDRNAAVTALMNRRDLGRGEAEQMVDNALAIYSGMSARASQTLENIQTQIQQTRAYIDQSIGEAREEAAAFSTAAARSALFAGLALIVGAVLATTAGWYGEARARRYFRQEIVESATISTGVLSEI